MKLSQIIICIFLTGCSVPYWHSSSLSEQEIAVVKYRCLQEAQQKESGNHFTFQHRDLNEVDKNKEEDKSPSESFWDGVFEKSLYDKTSSGNKSNMVLNDTLFESCMNAYGAYLKY